MVEGPTHFVYSFADKHYSLHCSHGSQGNYTSINTEIMYTLCMRVNRFEAQHQTYRNFLTTFNKTRLQCPVQDCREHVVDLQ